MILYAATIFLSAFLLFQIQPMIAKMILPWFGGSAAVWITAMLFFQLALLGGYLYAHWSVNRLKPKTQFLLHALLLGISIAILPVAPGASWKPAGPADIDEPILGILGALTFSVGLPYFLLSTTSPLIQAWYARTHKSALPYRLFGLSNLASLLGLLAYPVLVEPNVTLRQQSVGWSAAYAAFVGLCVWAAFTGRESALPEQPISRDTEADGAAQGPPKVREQFLWMLLAACASALLLAVTNHLTQNVASIPFLWVLPLCLYLLTFILCFDHERIYRRKVFLWLLLAAFSVMSYGLVEWNSRTNLLLVIPAFAIGMFICCMFCHGELVKRKPAPRFLTSFYLMLSLGGALGGLLVGLAAPKLLPGYFELPLALMFCAVLALAVVNKHIARENANGAVVTVACTGVVAGAVFSAGLYYIYTYSRASLVMERNFYGSLRVYEYDKGTKDAHKGLVHGTVMHGVQFTAPERRRERTSYYGPGSGISLAVDSLREANHAPLRIGVVGLGAGALASVAQTGDVIRFYELNPQVEKVCRDQFSFLSDCPGTVEVVLGDGRLSLEREPIQHYDLLVADAFSGDSVPVHLISLQALEVYFRHLKPGGILALNITNSHIELAPVVDKLSKALGKHAVMVSSLQFVGDYPYNADWALVSSGPITAPAILKVAKKLPSRPELRVWTDDYNNLFQILKKRDEE